MEGMPCDRLSTVTGFFCGRLSTSGCGQPGRVLRSLGCLISPGWRWFTCIAGFLRTGLLEEDDVPSGNLVQIPFVDCFHPGIEFSFKKTNVSEERCGRCGVFTPCALAW